MALLNATVLVRLKYKGGSLFVSTAFKDSGDDLDTENHVLRVEQGLVGQQNGTVERTVDSALELVFG